MNGQEQAKRQEKSSHEHAVVIGSGIAGLTAANVLAEHFATVTLIERDHLPEQAAFRPGIPQALHAHTLLPHGQTLLKQQFPGLVKDLLDQGAQTINDETETAYFSNGIWQKPSQPPRENTIACSRPLLENSIYQRVAATSGVYILQGYEVSSLITDSEREQVIGVVLRKRGMPPGEFLKIKASLVVDASGRNSKAPEWLENLGFMPPEEWKINAYAGYASRIYRQPQTSTRVWKKLYVSPRPPDHPRGGMILPLEGNRWHVTLIGIGGDFPPTDEAGFLEFARSLPAPDLYEAIRQAQPLSRVSGYRRNENRARRYECLPRYLEGFLVIGDAVFTMNPVYALGMTAALEGSQVLRESLSAIRRTGSLAGLAERFQKRLAHNIQRLWHQAIENEWQWPGTDISDNTEELYARIPA